MATTIQQIELPKKARALDTSGNNNHGQIYSGRGLEFDGVADCLTGLPSPTAQMTISLWVYASSSATGGLITWDESGGNHDYDFVLSRTGGKIVAKWDTDTEDGTTVTSVYSLEENTWYRVTVTQSSDTFKIYINGQLDISSSITAHLSGSRVGAIGRMYADVYSSENFFDGKMSDVQVWDTAWTAADVTYDYLNPESLALNNSGTALTESNLKLWYPMQDGHRGQQSYILDGANTGAVSEKVKDGDFAASSNWSFYNSSLVGEAVRINNVGLSGINAYIIQSSILEAGRLYKFECDVISTNGKDLVLENASPANISVGATTVGHKSIYFTQGASTQLTLKRAAAETDVTVDNISIKAINDKNHATTVFYGDDLWDIADNNVANWTTIAGSSEAVIGGTTDGVKLICGSNPSELGSYIYLKDTTTGTLTEDLTVGRQYTLSGLFATDVAGATNAPRLTVYTNAYNYPSTATVPATNLIANGTMEVDDNWSTYNNANVNERSSTQAHNGTYSRKFTPDSASEGIQSDTFTTVTGTTYLVSFWVYPDDGTIVRSAIRNGGTGAWVKDVSTTGLTENAWNKVEFQYTENSGGANAYMIIHSNSQTSGDFYIDDVVVTAFLEREITFTASNATTDRLYHLNCDFTAGNDLISQVDDVNSILDGTPDWQAHAAPGGAASVSYDATENEVTFATSTNTATEGMKLTYGNYSPLEMGRTYTIKINMRAASGTPTVRVYMGASNVATATITTSDANYGFSVTPNNLGGSLFITLADTTGIDITVSKVEIFPNCNLYVDDLSFKEVGVASGWTDADQQLHIPQTALQSYNELLHGFSTEASGSTHVLIADNAALNVGEDDFSMSLWFKTDDDYDTYTAIWRKGGWGSEGYSLGFDASGNLAINTATTGNNDWGYTATTIEKGKWYHVVGVWDRSANQTLYLNGVEQTMVNGDISGNTGDLSNTSTAMIGSSANGRFTGCITEVALFKTIVLSDAEVLELYNDGKALDVTTHSQVANLTGYWRNNGLSTWNDLSTNSNNGTVTGTETILIPQGVDSSRDNQGFIMNRQRDTSSLNLTSQASDYGHVSIPERTRADDGAISFVVWLKPEDITANLFLGSSVQDFIEINNATTIRIKADNATAKDFVFSAIVPGEWIHVALTWSAADSVLVYVNGSPAAAGAQTYNEPFDYKYIGTAAEAASYGFRGQVDGFLEYSDVLDSTEVTRNYNATKGSHRN